MLTIVPLICIATAPFAFIAGFFIAIWLDVADAAQLRAENARLRTHTNNNVTAITDQPEPELTGEIA